MKLTAMFTKNIFLLFKGKMMNNSTQLQWCCDDEWKRTGGDTFLKVELFKNAALMCEMLKKQHKLIKDARVMHRKTIKKQCSGTQHTVSVLQLVIS